LNDVQQKYGVLYIYGELASWAIVHVVAEKETRFVPLDGADGGDSTMDPRFEVINTVTVDKAITVNPISNKVIVDVQSHWVRLTNICGTLNLFLGKVIWQQL